LLDLLGRRIGVGGHAGPLVLRPQLLAGLPYGLGKTS
jgi:hypothetical protein